MNNIEKNEEGHYSSFSKRYKLIRSGTGAKVIDTLRNTYDKNKEIFLILPDKKSAVKRIFIGFHRRLDAFELAANIRSQLRYTLD